MTDDETRALTLLMALRVAVETLATAAANADEPDATALRLMHHTARQILEGLQ